MSRSICCYACHSPVSHHDSNIDAGLSVNGEKILEFLMYILYLGEKDCNVHEIGNLVKIKSKIINNKLNLNCYSLIIIIIKYCIK